METGGPTAQGERVHTHPVWWREDAANSLGGHPRGGGSVSEIQWRWILTRCPDGWCGEGKGRLC